MASFFLALIGAWLLIIKSLMYGDEKVGLFSACPVIELGCADDSSNLI